MFLPPYCTGERGHGYERAARSPIEGSHETDTQTGIKSHARANDLLPITWAQLRGTERVNSTFSTRFGFFQRKRPYSGGDDDQWVNGSSGHVVKPTAAVTAPTSMVATAGAGTGGGSVRQRPPSLTVPTTSDRHRSSYDEYQCVLLPGDEVL